MKLMKKLLCFVLVMSMAFCLCACGSDDESEQDVQNDVVEENETSDAEDVQNEEEQEAEEQETAAAFLVKVVDEGNNPVAGVMIQICKDSCIPAMSDEDGVASFNIEIEEGHKLSVMSCPEEYVYDGEAEVYLESGSTEYTVVLKGVK